MLQAVALQHSEELRQKFVQERRLEVIGSRIHCADMATALGENLPDPRNY